MQYERSELIDLARAYLAEFPEVAASRLSREILGHDKLFARLFAGDDCLTESARLASRWFEESWPLNLPWPIAVGGPRRRQALGIRRKGKGQGQGGVPDKQSAA